MTTTLGAKQSYAGVPTLELVNERIHLTIAPGVGGRVISLVDRATGREWLVQGDVPPSSRDWALPGAIFGPSEAAGWDECLPTVAAVVDPLGDGRSPLRDHGDVWGRPTAAQSGPDSIIVALDGVTWPYRFTRNLHLEQDTVVVRYTLTNSGPRALPFLWSMHALFDLEAGCSISVDGIHEVRLMYAAGMDLGPVGAMVGWPRARQGDGSEFDLAAVPGEEARTAVKLQAALPSTVVASGIGRTSIETPDGSSLTITWDPSVAKAAAMWLDHGGWPADAGRRQVSIGPTTSPHDDLASASAAGQALMVESGSPRSWEVRMALRPATTMREPAAGS